MQPTAEFRQHHTVEAPQVDERHFRQYCRRKPQIEILRDSCKISRTEWRAADRYHKNWCIAYGDLMSAINLTATGHGSGAGDYMTVRRTDALQALERIDGALNNRTRALIYVCVIEDRKWVDLGRQYRVAPQTAQAWVVAAIKALAAL